MRLVVSTSRKDVPELSHSATPSQYSYNAALVLQGTRGSVRGWHRSACRWLALSLKFIVKTTSVARELVHFSG